MLKKIKPFWYWCFERLSSLNLIGGVNFLFYTLMVTLLFFLCFFIRNFFDSNSSPHYVSYLAILASLAALITLVYNVRRHLSEDYCKEAKEYLKRSFEVLAPKDESSLPPNSRRSWLTAARFLKTSERLSKKIIMTSHKDAYVEEAEFWRVRYREIIKDFPEDYYAESPDKFIIWGSNDRDPIAESSIYVIYKFMEWDATYSDPLPNMRFSGEDIKRLRRRTAPKLASFLEATRKK